MKATGMHRATWLARRNPGLSGVRGRMPAAVASSVLQPAHTGTQHPRNQRRAPRGHADGPSRVEERLSVVTLTVVEERDRR